MPGVDPSPAILPAVARAPSVGPACSTGAPPHEQRDAYAAVADALVEAADPLVDRLDEPPVFAPPDGWTLTASWRRAQLVADEGAPTATPGYRRVLLGESATAHRVLFVLSGGELRAECDCDGWRYREWCAPVAALWWRWSRGRIDVVDLDTGRLYPRPTAWFDLSTDPAKTVVAEAPRVEKGAVKDRLFPPLEERDLIAPKWDRIYVRIPNDSHSGDR